jgi:hypothetical protein
VTVRFREICGPAQRVSYDDHHGESETRERGLTETAAEQKKEAPRSRERPDMEEDLKFGRYEPAG